MPGRGPARLYRPETGAGFRHRYQQGSADRAGQAEQLPWPKLPAPTRSAGLAPDSLYATTLPELDLCDEVEPDTAWLTRQCKEAEEEALSVPGITNSEGADAGYSRSTICLAIDNGGAKKFAKTYDGSHFSLSVSVLAGTGTGMERDYEFSSTRHRGDLMEARDIGIAAGQRAIKKLSPRKVATCQVPVVFDPRVSRSLVSVLANSLSGNAIARGASFLKDAMGEQLFPDGVTVTDNPHLVRGLSSRPFDGEGVGTRKTIIIENGMLKTWFLDIRSAGKLGLATTGHASRGLASPPSPSSTNLYMENGAMTPAALMKDINNGLYVTDTFGMGINTITGDYSQGASGFWIENGEIAYPVSEITIAGQLRNMFRNLTAANDLSFRYSTNAPDASHRCHDGRGDVNDT